MKRLGLPFAVFAWLLVVGAGFFQLSRHANTPGASAALPNATSSGATSPNASASVSWPAQSRLPRNPNRATLLVFAHPKCPCTRATLNELSRVMARSNNRANCFVIFNAPQGLPARDAQTWSNTPIVHAARRIAGVQVRLDEEREAKRFGARTSGQTFLFDAQGRLRFSGGLTVARAHEGDNAGTSAVRALLSGSSADGENTVKTPVFGCAL